MGINGANPFFNYGHSQARQLKKLDKEGLGTDTIPNIPPEKKDLEKPYRPEIGRGFVG